jgi:hypothetical protein
LNFTAVNHTTPSPNRVQPGCDLTCAKLRLH